MFVKIEYILPMVAAGFAAVYKRRQLPRSLTAGAVPVLKIAVCLHCLCNIQTTLTNDHCTVFFFLRGIGEKIMFSFFFFCG